MEEWRQAFNGTYEVSSLGNIRRAANGRKTYVGRIVRPNVMPTGYLNFGFTIGGKNRNHYIHRIVAEAFLGPCPTGLVVNHKNGIKTDNRIENLEYVSRAENNLHAIRIGLRRKKAPKVYIPKGRRDQSGMNHWTRKSPHKIKFGAGHPNSKLSKLEVDAIFNLWSSGQFTQIALAKQFRISTAQVCRILNKQRWVVKCTS